MLSRNLLWLLMAFILALVAIGLAAIAWARVNELSLPLPTVLPAINVLLPIFTAIAWPILRGLTARAKQHALRILSPYLAHASVLAPFALLILSLVYAVPSDIQSCAAETQWSRLFRHKDEWAIRSIQIRLYCCGFNSLHDRAWPFPSRTVGSDACERTQGYHVACAGGWRQEEVFVAALTGVASFLNWLFMVLAVMYFPQQDGRIRLPAWSSQQTRLITEDAGEDHEEQEAITTPSEERGEQTI